MRDAVREWQALSALYEQAETLTAPELEHWLARLRHEAHPLLEPLRQMLGARAEVRDKGFLAELPRLPGAAASRDGERIGPYRLLAPIGSGGMAEVWRAERGDGAFQRTVAIKLLFRHLGGARGESFARRFGRERDILASLDHPHIACLHDAGVTPAGQPWLAIEYVEGEPLGAWCDRSRLGVRGRVELFRQVLLAVEHAHANLVIHRDLKPANILVSAAGEVRLLDFGIAKLLEAEGGVLDDTDLTRHAGRMMTVAYASPEQLTGRPLTTATDVYSLGVVLYELLCGERPYELRDELPLRLEQAILETDPRPPSRRSLGDAVAAARGTTGPALRKALARDLDAVVLRALAKQPARRYGSAEALRVELDRWLAGEPVEARTPGRAERLRKFVGRHPVGVGLGSAAVLALATVASVAVVLGLQARQESARATAARDFMMGMFRQADSDKSHGADMTARELLDRGRDDVLRRLRNEPALQADLLQGIAGIQSSMGEVTKADVTLEALAALHRRLGDALGTARTLSARADNALRLGRLDLAAALVAEVEALPRSARNDAETATAIGATRGWLALWGGEAARAKTVFLQVLSRAEAAFGPDARQALAALVGIVQAEAALHEFDAALGAQQELTVRQMRAADRTPRDVVDLDVNRAELLFAAGRYRDAALLEREALPKCAASLGIDDASCRRLAYRGFVVNLRLGSMASVRHELPVVEAVSKDSSSPDLRTGALVNLFRAYSRLGALHAHPDVVAAANDLASASGGHQAPDRVLALHALAEDALRAGDPAAAMRWLAQALDLCGAGCGLPGYSTVGTTRVLMGAALLAQGRYVDALAQMQRGQIDQIRELGESSPLARLFSLDQALVLERLGRPRDALAIVDSADPVLRPALGAESPVFHRIDVLRARLTLQAASPPAASPAVPELGRVELFN